MIGRDIRLQKYATEFKSWDDLAQRIGKEVTLHSRKARNKHIYQLKILFFDNSSVFQIAKHVLAADSHDDDGDEKPMTMLPIFADLETCKDCSKLLMSSNMHAHQEFYSHFVAALASGRLCNIKKQPVLSPLTEFISIDHEAHFRLEMWYCLNKQGKCKSYPILIFTSLLSLLFVVLSSPFHRLPTRMS